MRRSRFSVEQIVASLKQVELGMPVSDLIRQLGISEQTFYRWKKLYGGLQSDQVRELKQLQEQNARLEKMAAELTLKLPSLTVRRQVVHYLGQCDRVSKRPACRCMLIATRSLR